MVVSLIRPDHVAGAERGAPRAPVESSPDLGVAVLDARLFELRARRLDLGPGLRLGGDALIEGRLRDGVGAHQFPPALDLGGGVVEIGDAAVDLRLAQRDLGREGRLLDGEEQVVRLDRVAFVEVAGVEEAGDARADIDLVDRLDAADELGALGNRLHGDALDGDRRRRARLTRRRGGFLAAGERQHHRQLDEGGDHYRDERDECEPAENGDKGYWIRKLDVHCGRRAR